MTECKSQIFQLKHELQEKERELIRLQKLLDLNEISYAATATDDDG